MAEAVPFGIATNILMKLGSSTFQEIGSIYGVNKELRKLESTLSTIKAALLDAEEKQEKSYLVKDWIRKLKDVVYDADDLLDAFATKALQRQLATQTRIKEQVSEFFSSSNQLAFRYKMGLKIKDIRERLDDIAADMSKFNFRERVVEMQVENREVREQTHSFVLTSEIIGREKDKEEIVESLMCSRHNENISIIPIVGIGGSGKTTLAQLAYNDRRVVSFFEKRLWVCVSKYFDVKMIVAHIVKSVTKSDPGNIDLDQLQICLREHLDGKRYLLVLDDVWNESHERWSCLKNLLMVGAYGSKVIVTTRSRNVASVMGANSPYVLEGLTEDQCWNLFEHLAFRGREGVHSSLIEIGKDIVRRCKGVPFAVRSLGSVMQSKTEESEWLSIQNNDIWRASLDENGILPVLKLSYDHLPIHLRQCFAYCSIFPKDYIIQKDMLIQLWIAQGYIHSESGKQHLEEIGDQYFKDLLTRSFFQEVETDYGNGQSFKMHDLIHDLAQVVAGADCSVAGVDAENISERVRHMSLQYSFCPWEVPRNLLEAKGMRTFFLPSYCGLTDESAPDKLMSNLKRLRVLDLHHSCIKKLSDSLGKMEHLRYLDLSDNGEMERLPCCISNLHNLQKLALSDCKNLRELPRDIRKLISLRYLMIEGCDRLTHMPAGLGKLTSLRTLPRFIVAKNKDCFADSGKLNELNVLNHLRGELSLENLENVTDAALESKDSNLKEKRSLRSLSLNWGPSETSESQNSELLLENLQPHRNLRELCVQGYRGKRFSSWLSLLHNLGKLTIKKCRQCQYLPPLNHLSALKVLNLKELTDLEYIDDSSSDPSSSLVFFPSLRELSLVDLPNLKRWWKSEVATNAVNNNSGTSSSSAEQQEQKLMLLPSFPRLSRLKIFHCFSLTSMPLHPYLEQLHLYEVSEKLLQQQSTMMMMTMTMTITMMMMMMATLQSPTGATIATTSSSNSSLSPSSYPSSSSSSLPPCSFSASPLSKLRSLQIERIEGLESLPEEWLPNLISLELLKVEQCPQLLSLPQEGFRALTSLRSLRIYRCEGLISLSQGIQYLTALEELKIRSCEDLDLSDDGMQLQGLGRLFSVELSDLPKLVALPNWLQHIHTLKELMIEDLHGLTTLPEWIGSLKSLQCLKISFCQGLTSLPERMRSLTALQQLNICNCPRLSKGCRKATGVDWPKISHIPIIKTEGKWIQGRT